MFLKNVLLTILGTILSTALYCTHHYHTIGAQELEHSSEPFFVIVVPSYNNKLFYNKNLDSIVMQDYERYHVLYTDDASTDGTGDLVEQYIQDNNLSATITLIKNAERVGALANTYAMAHMCHPQCVICVVDGDDWLAHSWVLSYLANIYKTEDTWLTYGQYQWLSSCSLNGRIGVCEPVPHNVIVNGTIRQYKWITSALRTFYAQLFHMIDKNDLLYEGSFFSTAGDLAYMFPMVEMAGFHIRCISNVLYIYNFNSSINDEKVHLALQQKFDRIIRSRKKYRPLESLGFAPYQRLRCNNE